MSTASAPERLIEQLVPNPILRGVLYAALAGVVFQLMNMVVRQLTLELPPLVVSWLRWTFGLVLVLPLFLPAGLSVAKTRQFPRHLLRSGFHACAYTMWYLAIPLISLAEAAAISFSGPIFVTLGAALVLGEQVTARRWIAVFVGFLGVLIVLAPKLSLGVSASVGVLLLLASVPLVAASNLTVKYMTKADGTLTILFWQNVLASALFLPMALWFWVTPSALQLALALLAAFLGTTAYWLITASYRAADISATQPIVFLSIVWATGLDWLAFGKQPDLWTIAGAAVIVGGAAFASHREAQASRASPKPA
jgi:drug/metabolite transporter (DMT)-like permease